MSDQQTDALREQIKATLDLGLQAWRTTPRRDDFAEAQRKVDALAARLSECEAALRKIECMAAAAGYGYTLAKPLAEAAHAALAAAQTEGKP